MLLFLNQPSGDSDSLLSSTKLCKSDFVSHKNKSFIKMLNRIGLIFEPYDTPKS